MYMCWFVDVSVCMFVYVCVCVCVCRLKEMGKFSVVVAGGWGEAIYFDGNFLDGNFPRGLFS